MPSSSARHWSRLARNRDFTVLWLSSTISELGTRVSLIAFPLLGFALTGSTGWAAAAEALYLGGLVAALLPGGVAADRLDRRLLMRTVSLAGVALYASLAVAGLVGILTIGHVLAVATLTGVGAGVFQPAETSAVRAVVATEDLPTALAQQQARQHVASLVGGPVGGALFAVVRWLPFAADAVSYLLCWLLLGRTELSPDRAADRLDREPGSRPAPVRRELAAGLRFTWSQPFLRVTAMWAPLMNLVLNTTFFVALLRLVRSGFPALQIGLVETSVGLFGILGAVVAPRLIDRLPTGILIIVAAWVFVPLTVPLALWNHPWAMCACISPGLLLNPATNAGIGSYRMAVTPPALIGRVQSAAQFVSMLSMPLAPALAGLLLALVGGRDAILALAGLTAAAALIPTLSASVRSIPRPDRWPAHPAPLDARSGAAA